MEIYVGQIYIQQDVNFGFSYLFQRSIHSFLSENIKNSERFCEKYKDYTLMFRMSAKKDITENEIKGPTIFRKDKDMEYSIFLPFDEIMKNENYNYFALKYLFEGIYSILDKYGFDFSIIKKEEEKFINTVLNDPSMLYEK